MLIVISWEADCIHHFRLEIDEKNNPINPACPVKPSFASVSPVAPEDATGVKCKTYFTGV